MKEFKNAVEYTEWLMKQVGEKKIRLRNFYKITSATVQPIRTRNGEWLGVQDPDLIRYDPNQKMGYVPTPDSKRVLEDGVTFDLTKEKDRKDWDWVKYSRYIVMTKEDIFNDKNAIFYIDTPEYEANIKVSSFEKKLEAMQLINELTEDSYPELLGLLGTTSSFMTSNQVKSYLYQMANETKGGAGKIVGTIKDPDYYVKTLLLKAKRKGVVIKDASGFFRYNDINLGFDEKVVVEFLKDQSKNGDIIDEIKKQTLGVSSIVNKDEVKAPIKRKSPGRKPKVETNS